MNKSLFFFTNNLRIQHNAALNLAGSQHTVLPIFVYDEAFNTKTLGRCSKVWLHHSLIDLKKSCPHLSIFKDKVLDIIPKLVKKHDIKCVYLSTPFGTQELATLKSLEELLKPLDCSLKALTDSVLWAPHNVLKKDLTPYKVFTPYYQKGCLNAVEPELPPTKKIATCHDNESLSVDELNLLTGLPWETHVIKNWDISEKGAQNRLKTFFSTGLDQYKEGRNMPALAAVSRLSPYIHFGNISIQQIWHEACLQPASKNRDHFLSELGWREFSYSLITHFPAMINENLQKKFDNFPWSYNPTYFDAWKKGLTGYPIVDAGMRELWQTGYMHNRVRMIVGSFLVKNLLIDWKYGEKWFWDCLFDADLANNTASWQWVAGCGADAAPYFRIFNPITQGLKFDPNGDYTLKYIPELKKIPKKYLFSPWEAPEDIMKALNIELGKDYPHPIVNLADSRDAALTAFETLKALS